MFRTGIPNPSITTEGRGDGLPSPSGGPTLWGIGARQVCTLYLASSPLPIEGLRGIDTRPAPTPQLEICDG